jgi:integrase
MTERLTDRMIAKLPLPGTGNRIHFDSEIGGFGVRITAAGARAFVLCYRNRAGRQRRYTIGSLPEWTVSAARAEAKELKRQIDQGNDPLSERIADREAPTMAELCQRFIDEHLPKRRPSTRTNYAAAIRNVILPKLGALKVADITFADVDTLHRKITKDGVPVQANRILAQLSKMFSLAIKWGWRTDSPCRGVEFNHEEKRERYLSPEELSRLGETLDKFHDKQAAAVIALLLLTGSRVGEVLTMRWQDLDLNAGIWTKPSAHTKQKRTHRLPLSEPARTLLAKLVTNGNDTGYVFPGISRTGHRYEIKEAWKEICTSADIRNARIHDLRHTHASILVSAGYSLPIVGHLLGHTQPATTARYAHLADDPLRLATEKAGAIITSGNGH